MLPDNDMEPERLSPTLDEGGDAAPESTFVDTSKACEKTSRHVTVTGTRAFSKEKCLGKHFWCQAEDDQPRLRASFPDGIWTSHKLETLTLKECGKPFSFKSQLSLPALTKLTINRSIHGMEIPPVIGQLRNLVELELKFCHQIRRLPREIGHLRNLKNLTVIHNDSLESIPADIGKLQRLETLHFGKSSMLIVPGAEILSIQSLKQLILHTCKEIEWRGEELLVEESVDGLTQERIQSLPNLQVLDIESVHLKSFHTGFFKTANPKTLKIRDCGLSCFTKSVSQMPNLRKVEIWDCWSLQSFLPEIDIGQLRNLIQLEIVYRWCIAGEQLPTSIGQLTSLRRLTLKNCPVLSLPPSIGKLVNLQTLKIHGSNTIDLFNALPFLPQLKSLDLGITLVRRLTDSIQWKDNSCLENLAITLFDYSMNGRDILRGLPRTLRSLNLNYFQFWDDPKAILNESLPPDLRSLNLRQSRCKLNLSSPGWLACIRHLLETHDQLGTISFGKTYSLPFYELYLLNYNRCGRALFRTVSKPIPLSTWPTVLFRVHHLTHSRNQDACLLVSDSDDVESQYRAIQASVIYQLLRERPTLLCCAVADNELPEQRSSKNSTA